jgi:predicted acyltransferase
MTETPVIERSTDLTWDETHHLLVPLLRADNSTNIFYILGDYAGLVTSLVGCGWIYRLWWAGQLSTAPFLLLSIVGVMVIAALQHRLSGLGHEACHYALFKNRLANELISDLLCMFPLMAMTQGCGSPTWGITSFSTTRIATQMSRGFTSTATDTPSP